MTRRLPAGGNVGNRLLLTVTILLLAWLVDAQQQHQQPHSSPPLDYTASHDASTATSVSVLQATTVARQRHQARVIRDENYEYGEHNDGLDAAAAEPTARESVDVKAVIPAVRAPLSRRSGILDSADLTLHDARSLGDWDVEDFVLVADVEGRILARDRTTGKHRWIMDISKPMTLLLTIEAPPSEGSSEVDNGEPVDNTIPVLGPTESVLHQVRQLPAAAGTNITAWVSNPVTMIMSIVFFTWWLYNKRRMLYETAYRNPVIRQIVNALVKQTYHPETLEREDIAQAQKATPEPAKRELPVENVEEVVDKTPVPKLASPDGANDTPESDETDKISERGGDLEAIDETKESPAALLPPTPKPSGRTNAEGSRKRGKRGGKKKKKDKSDQSQNSDTSSMAVQPPKTVEGAVRDAQRLGEPKAMEPDVQTVPSAVSEVSGPILRINNLEVNTDKLIGTGSNGTMVFEGKLGGRVVAVKRMLIQFFEIASHETRLLEESDIHPNVVRYYVQQESQGFLYIALELCSASLADVIERPLKHLQLAQRGEKNTPNVLYQITNGLRHLHNLRIVHRDLKPQNILVSTTAEGNPRMLVSDFGLCKKLEGEQSSFRATTAHAAGTSGWRAPELLLDDDARHDNPAGFPREPISNMSENGSGPLVSTDLLPTRRATRAIDIFSLGLVFFYVLTRGCHPFDCGDRYMREVNIRKDQYDLSQLDSLGDDSFEAKDLITAMLQHEPKDRPTAAHVMAHPFFWSRERRLEFLCNVSDYFEKEKRDPPSDALIVLENYAPEVTRGDFLKPLGKEFLDSLGKQRKYTGDRMLDLLRALRNKKYHYEDMSESLKKHVGRLPEGYLSFWTSKFPNLLICCWEVVKEVEWEDADRFRKYYQPLPPHEAGSGV